MSRLSWENLYSYNRKILDATSNRYFFVAQPTELKVTGLPKTFQAKLPLHSEHPERGFREYTVVPEGDEKAVGLWISQKDAQAMEPEQIIRLMELFNIKIQNENRQPRYRRFHKRIIRGRKKNQGPTDSVDTQRRRVSNPS